MLNVNVHLHNGLFSPADPMIQLDKTGLNLQSGWNYYFVRFIPHDTKTYAPFEGIYAMELQIVNSGEDPDIITTALKALNTPNLPDLSPSTSPITINYIKYSVTDPSTDISDDKYYQRDENKGKTYFTFVNGANTDMNGTGGGTTGAINKINSELFDHNNIQLVYDPRDIADKGRTKSEESYDKLIKIISAIGQTVKYNGKSYPAGSVFVTKIKQKSGSPNHICVYHIKGLNLTGLLVGSETQIAPLVTTYYTELLKDFTTNVMKEIPNDQTPVLHLSPVPGYLFNGTEITENAMRKAVSDFQKTYKDRAFQINMGLDPVRIGGARKNKTRKNRR